MAIGEVAVRRNFLEAICGKRKRLGEQTMARNNHLRSILATLALFILVACGGEAPPPADSTPSTDEASTAPDASTYDAAASEPTSPALEPISTRTSTTSGGASTPPVTASTTGGEGGKIVAAGAVFTLPAAWRAEPPSSSMRLAQATIPGPGGDAQLTVFHFGVGGGGGVESNLDRWVGQMDLAPGSAPFRETFENAGLKVTWIDVLGTLKPSTMGTGPSTPQPDSELLGAVVEGPGGPWFFKATGPAATLTAARADFVDMLKGLRVDL